MTFIEMIQGLDTNKIAYIESTGEILRMDIDGVYTDESGYEFDFTKEIFLATDWILEEI